MKKIVLIIGLLLITNYTFAQCQSGDCKDGFSTMKYSDAIFQGNFVNGKYNDLGLMFYNDKRMYHGEYVDNIFNGYGYYKWKTGETYIGSWKNGLQSGLGIQRTASGTIQSAGTWIDGKITTSLSSTSPAKNPENCKGNCVDGIGDVMDKDSVRYIGIFKDKKIIFGSIQSKSYVYDGEIKNNIPNGFGQIKYLDINEFHIGYFKDGKKDGRGIYTNKSNKKTFGKWVNHVYQDPTLYQFNQKDFCNEIIAWAKLTKKERSELKVKEKHTSGITLEKQFLNEFKLKSDLYSDNFFGKEKIYFLFPKKNESKPTISYEKLIETCKSCKKLTSDKESYFKYNDVELYVGKYTSQMTLTYPKPDSCISGNCKNGKGKKRYSDAIFEGKFKDGNREGFGKITFTNGNAHEGEYKNDKRNGKGIFKWKEGDRYEGDFVDGFRTGNGKYSWASGDSYEGDFIKNKSEGYGTYIWVNGNKYVGDYKDNKKDGKGTFTLANGSKYIGDFKNNKYAGNGKEYDENGLLFYEGEYLNNQFEGKGTYYAVAGTKYVGQFKGDKYHGLGKFYNKEGKLQYEGNFKEGKANGKGVSYYDSGKKAYEGDFKNGKKNGSGTKYYTDGKYIGEFKNDLRQGNGKFYNLEGKLTFEGIYKDDKPIE